MDHNEHYFKGICQSCGGSLEFESRGVGETVECTHCGNGIILLISDSFGDGNRKAEISNNDIHTRMFKGLAFVIATVFLVSFSIGLVHFKTKIFGIGKEPNTNTQQNVLIESSVVALPQEVLGPQFFTNDGGVWNYEIESNCVVIVGYAGTNGDLSIPVSIYNLPVKIINNYAFSNSIALEEVSIPDGVESLYEGAFSGCVNLKHISISRTVTDIVGTAFDEPQRYSVIDVTSDNPRYASFHGTLFNRNLDFFELGAMGRMLHTGCPQCDVMARADYPTLPFVCTSTSDHKYIHITIKGQSLVLTVGHDYGDGAPVLDFQAEFARNQIPEFENMLSKFIEWDRIAKANNIVTPGITKSVPCGIKNLACFFHADEHLLTNDPQPYSSWHSGITSKDIPIIFQLLLNIDTVVSDWQKGKVEAQKASQDMQNRANVEYHLFK